MRKSIITAVAALAMAVAVAGTASAAPTKTTLVYDGAILGNGQSFWTGTIKSSNKACMLNRSVTVFKVKPGADKKIGTGKAHRNLNATGFNWDVSAVLAVKNGEKYYAAVKATASCGGDTSNVRAFKR